MGPDTIDPSDWVTIWHSEMAALAVDREAHELLRQLSQPGGAADGRHDGPAGRPGPDAPPGPAAVGAAPWDGDEIDRLRRRIAELEHAAGAGARS